MECEDYRSLITVCLLMVVSSLLLNRVRITKNQIKTVPFWIHIRFRDAFFQLSHRKFAGGVALRRFQSLICHLFPYSGLKQLTCLICSNGPAEIIALPLVASVTLEELQLLSGFNAFCDSALLQTFADIDHGA